MCLLIQEMKFGFLKEETIKNITAHMLKCKQWPCRAPAGNKQMQAELINRIPNYFIMALVASEEFNNPNGFSICYIFLIYENEFLLNLYKFTLSLNLLNAWVMVVLRQNVVRKAFPSPASTFKMPFVVLQASKFRTYRVVLL